MPFLYEEVVLLFAFIHTAEQFRGQLESAGKVSTEIVLLRPDCNLEYVFGDHCGWERLQPNRSSELDKHKKGWMEDIFHPLQTALIIQDKMQIPI